MYSLATDGSSDEEDKFFPIIITHEDVHTGLVTTSFIDMPVVNMATGENITNRVVVFQPQMLSACTIFHLFVNKNLPPYRFWNNKGWHVCIESS